jgi:hypothetical protein
MIFCEKLGVARYVASLISGNRVRYYKKGMFFSFISRVIGHSGRAGSVRRLDFGDVSTYTDVQKNAFANGRAYLSGMRHRRFLKLSNGLFGIDFAYVFGKFMFNQVLCPRYEFFELAVRYAKEHPEQRHDFYIDSPELAGPYIADFKAAGSVHPGGRLIFAEYLLSAVCCPVLLWFYWKTKGSADTMSFENKIICNAVKKPARDMYEELFGAAAHTRYTMSLPYLDRYTAAQMDEMGIIPLRLSLAGYAQLRSNVNRYVRICLSCADELFIYGPGMLRLFYHIIVGRENAPHGKGNIFVTFEHFDSAMAIRNEFIRSEGSRSVFFSKNLNMYAAYDYDESDTNYDCICSSGRQLEDHLRLGGVRTRRILPTGSYDAHKTVAERSAGVSERIERLRRSKGNAHVVITVLSCGLASKSRGIELKLMDLAEKISRQPGIKVFVRMKTRNPMPQHDAFYARFAQPGSSVVLTGAEHDLTDFLPVTDLFITSISNSGFDIAMRGGNVYFVDFLKIPDLFTAWDMFKGAVIDEERAFQKIIEWAVDSSDGPVRAGHRQTLAALREYIGYTFRDFASFKENLLTRLSDESGLFSAGSVKPKREYDAFSRVEGI